MSTRTQLRQAISRNLRDLELATVASMSGSNPRCTELKRFPDDDFNDGQVYCYSGTGAGESQFISDFAQTNGELTPLSTWGTAPVANDLLEVRKADGLLVAAYHDAIDQAYRDIEDIYLADKLSETLTMERSRAEYTIPSGWRYLSSVEYLMPIIAWGSHSYDYAYSLYTGATTRVRLAQSIKVGNDVQISGVRLYLRKLGTISTAKTLTLAIQGNSSGFPNGSSIVTDATATLSTDSIDGTPAYYAFTFTNAVLLSRDTTYHLVLSISGAVDAVNYIIWCADTDNAYADGSPATYDGTDWTAVSGTTLIFSVLPARPNGVYVKLPPNLWHVTRSDKLLSLDVRYEGAGIRIIGQGQASLLTADATESTVPEGYVINQATALLLPQLPGDRKDNRDIKALLSYYQGRAEALRSRCRVQPRPSSAIVDLR